MISHLIFDLSFVMISHPFMICHPVYNNDGVVKVHEERRTLLVLTERHFALVEKANFSCRPRLVRFESRGGSLAPPPIYAIYRGAAIMIPGSNSQIALGGRAPTQKIELPSRVLTG